MPLGKRSVTKGKGPRWRTVRSNISCYIDSMYLFVAHASSNNDAQMRRESAILASQLKYCHSQDGFALRACRMPFWCR